MNDIKDIINRLCDLERRMAKIEAQPVEQAEKQEKLCKYCGGIGRVVCNGRCMPEQEPKAWIYEGNLHIFDPTDWAIEPESVQPLYTAPPKREWVGLTDEERYLGDARSEEEIEYARAIEAKLKERNT